jgi:acyl carrier protein
MTVPSRAELLTVIHQMIVDACEKPVDPASIQEDETLFGPSARLALDSLDALQISMAVQKRFGLRLTDSKETRRILSCSGNLAQVLEAHLAARP